MSPLTALVRKELRVELRSLQGTVAAGMLMLALLLLLRFTLTNDEIAQARLAPAIIWSVLLFAGLGLLTHTALREATAARVRCCDWHRSRARHCF